MNFGFILDKIRNTLNILSTKKTDSHNLIGRLITIPSKGYALIIGDLHGDLLTFNKIIENSNITQNLENKDYYLIFLGDYIDRGPKQIEVMCNVMDLYEKFPSQVILLRGNHEGPNDIIFRPHDFPTRLKEKFGNKGEFLYLEFKKMFKHLYTGVIIRNRALLLHGGIPINVDSLSDIAFAHITHPNDDILTEILWNDPFNENGVKSSPRGIGKLFGINITTQFLNKIGATTLIRGHESCYEGFYFHNEKVLTIFSCKLPYYGNKYAAYLDIPLKYKFTIESLKKHIFKL